MKISTSVSNTSFLQIFLTFSNLMFAVYFAFFRRDDSSSFRHGSTTGTSFLVPTSKTHSPS
jgi:hypothetical protein